MRQRIPTLLILLAVFSATFIPRMMLIGGPPATDEGIYAYNAMMIYRNPPPGWLLPDFGILSLYSALLSWVYAFDLNHFVLLRLADAVVAGLSGVMLYRVLSLESGSRIAGALIAVGFLLTINDPVFIQYGFKNSIAAATLLLLSAIWLGLRAQPHDCKPWFWSGVLVALAVLLREPFVAIALLGTFAVYGKGGLPAARRYAAGGIVAATLAMLAVALLRGGSLSALVQAYTDTGLLYADMGGGNGKYVRSLHSFYTFLQNASGVLLILCLLLSMNLRAMLTGESRSPAARYLFWLGLTAAPLLEPLLKNGFPYHYATCLIGLAGLTALLWRDLASRRSHGRWLPVGLGVLFAITLVPTLHQLTTTYRNYTASLLNTPLSGWPAETASASNFLLIADRVRKLAAPGDTLSVNGNLLGVLPLAGLPPPHYDLANIEQAYLYASKSEQRLRQMLYSCPASFIVVSTHTRRNTSALLSVIRGMPEYALAGYIGKSPSRHYGTFDGAIMQWTGPRAPCQPRPKRVQD